MAFPVDYFRSKPKLRPEISKVDKGITIVFHAILAGKFKGSTDVNIFIRGDHPIFHGWDVNAVDIAQVK